MVVKNKTFSQRVEQLNLIKTTPIHWVIRHCFSCFFFTKCYPTPCLFEHKIPLLCMLDKSGLTVHTIHVLVGMRHRHSFLPFSICFSHWYCKTSTKLTKIKQSLSLNTSLVWIFHQSKISSDSEFTVCTVVDLAQLIFIGLWAVTIFSLRQC